VKEGRKEGRKKKRKKERKKEEEKGNFSSLADSTISKIF